MDQSWNRAERTLEPNAWSEWRAGKNPRESMVGVTGFEPATPTSRTPEEPSDNNDLGGPG